MTKQTMLRSSTASAAIDILRPQRQALPLVFSSPHSGRHYAPEFVAMSGLDPMTLRRSEDAFVDLLFEGVVEIGAPLLRANFPRAFVDVNREPYELDPAMFVESLPYHVNSSSARVAAGLGTIARVVARGQEIYRRKLNVGEIEQRLDQCYRPYHDALRQLVAETRRKFGYCIIIDCHSMPSMASSRADVVGGNTSNDTNIGLCKELGVVLGDSCGRSCSGRLTELAEDYFATAGYLVQRNVPYAGGFITDRYGRPESNMHSLQIELNRALYLDEGRYELLPQWQRLARDLVGLAGQLGQLTEADLALAGDQRRGQYDPSGQPGSGVPKAGLWPHDEKRAAT